MLAARMHGYRQPLVLEEVNKESYSRFVPKLEIQLTNQKKLPN